MTANVKRENWTVFLLIEVPPNGLGKKKIGHESSKASSKKYQYTKNTIGGAIGKNYLVEYCIGQMTRVFFFSNNGERDILG